MRVLLLCMGLAWMAGQTQAQDWLRLDELKSSSRNPFLVQGCHADLCGKEWDSNAKVLQNNYDMGPSIARSDSFDVQHYDLTLDVTAYNQQAMSGHAVIDFDVLTGGGSRVWWDFVGMAVDSVQWNGVGAVHHHWGPELHVDAPSAMEAGEVDGRGLVLDRIDRDVEVGNSAPQSFDDGFQTGQFPRRSGRQRQPRQNFKRPLGGSCALHEPA